MSVYRVCLQTGASASLPLFLPSLLLSSLTPGHKASPHVLIVQEQPAKTAISRPRQMALFRSSHNANIAGQQHCVCALTGPLYVHNPALIHWKHQKTWIAAMYQVCAFIRRTWWVSTGEWLKWQTLKPTNGMWEGLFLKWLVDEWF